MRHIFIVIAVTVVAAAAPAQQTLQVPSQYASIQAAINAAQPSDSVVVSPGLYLGGINFLGKAITVRSSDGPAVTTIDGQNAVPGAQFVNGEGPNSILEGFTIKRGKGVAAASGFPGGGGGITCFGSSPTIRRCTIENCVGGNGAANLNESQRDGGAGGIQIHDGAPLIENCTIRNCFGGNGGSLASSDTSPAGAGGAGAIGLLGTTSGATTVVRHTFLRSNTGGIGGSALQVSSTHSGVGGSGGIHVRKRSMLVESTRCENSAGGPGGSGAGFGLSYSYPAAGGSGAVHADRSATVTIRNSWFTKNSGGAGGFYPPNPLINGPTSGGSAALSAVQPPVGFLLFPPFPPPTVITVEHSTIGHNGMGGDLVRASGSLSSMTITRSILWGNAITTRTNVATSNCDVETGPLGNGDVTSNPMFVDGPAGNLHVTPGSPCVDILPPTVTTSTSVDIDGEPRMIGAAVDVGADEMNCPDLTHRGSCEDFVLETRINGGGDPTSVVKSIAAGDTLTVVMRSPLGGFVGERPLLFGELYPSGMPPQSPIGFPEIHVSIGGVFVLFDPLVAEPDSTLPIEGMTFSFPIPVSLPDLTGVLQSVCFSFAAKNGIFSISNAHEIVF